jgi:hypothetical protein
MARKKKQKEGEMRADDDRASDLLDSFLRMPSDARRSFLVSLDADQLALLISIFSSGLTEKIAQMARKPDTPRARRTIARIELYEDESGEM